MVFVGFKIIWRLATSPTRFLTGSTIEGVTFRPVSAAEITLGVPPSMTATQELVVPKSIPIILLMFLIYTISNPVCQVLILRRAQDFDLSRPNNKRFYFIAF